MTSPTKWPSNEPTQQVIGQVWRKVENRRSSLTTFYSRMTWKEELGKLKKRQILKTDIYQILVNLEYLIF